MSLAKASALVLILQSVSVITAQAADGPAPGVFKKAMVVVLENTDYSAAIKQPFLSKLIAGGALLSKYFAVTHPSQPNYIAMISGSTQGVLSDFNANLDGSHLGDLLEAHGKSWKVYAEDFPGNCFLGASSGLYARKHVPFLSFRNVQKDPIRCARVVNATELKRDVAGGNLPDFSFYTPGLDDDGHDTDVGYADRWLARAFGPLIQDPKFMQDMALIITFDEGSDFGSNQVLTVVYGAGVKPGSVSTLRYNHYSLLSTIEAAFELGDLGRSDQNAQPFSGIWQ